MPPEIELARCVCGWPRPLIAVTTTGGELPREPLAVRYDCPECGRVHHCGEPPLSTVAHSKRARDLARGGRPVD